MIRWWRLQWRDFEFGTQELRKTVKKLIQSFLIS
jgi:hypothetical protein